MKRHRVPTLQDETIDALEKLAQDNPHVHYILKRIEEGADPARYFAIGMLMLAEENAKLWKITKDLSACQPMQINLHGKEAAEALKTLKANKPKS